MPSGRSKKIRRTGIERNTSASGLCCDDVDLMGENINIIKKNAEVLLDASKEIRSGRKL
jgi:hypothetical protein